jgi:hypothetical protein
MRVLKLTLGKIIFLQSFLMFSASSVKRPDGPVLESRRLQLYQSMIWQYTVQSSVYHVRTQALCFLCHSYSTVFFLIFVMLCVSLTDFSRDFHFLYTSFFIPWYSLCLPCSFNFLCFLEYWIICWMENFLEILCMKILLCLCVRLIWIYLGHLDCSICLCIFGIQLTAVTIPHCFLN